MHACTPVPNPRDCAGQNPMLVRDLHASPCPLPPLPVCTAHAQMAKALNAVHLAKPSDVSPLMQHAIHAAAMRQACTRLCSWAQEAQATNEELHALRLVAPAASVLSQLLMSSPV